MTDQATQLRKLVQDCAAARRPTASVHVPASMRSGVVSYRPRPGRHTNGHRIVPQRVGLARAIAVTSGKGGVGKTNLAVNLSVCLASLGKKVCLLDADLGLANADVLCNLSPKVTLEHVVSGRCRLAEAMLLAPGGFRLIPGASGVARLADLDGERRLRLLSQLAALEQLADVVVIDTAAGLSANVLAFAAAAHRVLVVTTPEPTAITDGYGMIKALLGPAPKARIELVVNMAGHEQEAYGVFDRMNRVSRTFLKRSIGYAGAIPMDGQVRAAVRQRVPFVLYSPQAAATQAMRRLARDMAGVGEPNPLDSSQVGFFARVASWLGRTHSSSSAQTYV